MTADQKLHLSDAAVDRVARVRAAEDRKNFDTASEWMREKYRAKARTYLEAAVEVDP